MSASSLYSPLPPEAWPRFAYLSVSASNLPLSLHSCIRTSLMWALSAFAASSACLSSGAITTIASVSPSEGMSSPLPPNSTFASSRKVVGHSTERAPSPLASTIILVKSIEMDARQPYGHVARTSGPSRGIASAYPLAKHWHALVAGVFSPIMDVEMRLSRHCPTVATHARATAPHEASRSVSSANVAASTPRIAKTASAFSLYRAATAAASGGATSVSPSRDMVLTANAGTLARLGPLEPLDFACLEPLGFAEACLCASLEAMVLPFLTSISSCS
mmetsp:Transcript_17737/g.42858  ORF Transcript_17737/g.42858 Transcript_17737/m.42858 type:complete len:276 (+) Transcript_17737:1120-1947(+)